MKKHIFIDVKMLFVILGLTSLCPGMYLLHAITTSKIGEPLYYFSSTNRRNLHTYVISMALVVLTFSVLCFFCRGLLAKKRKYEAFQLPMQHGFLWLIALLSICGFLLYDLFLNNEDKFAGYATKFPLWFSLPIVVVSVLFIYFKAIYGNDSRHKNYALFALYILSAFFNAVKYAHINTFSSVYAFYHCNAVTQTIYNVHHNTPFNELTSGIYGHYALFFKPFTAIFGANPISIGILIGLVGFATTFLSIATMHIIIKSNILKAVSAISIAFFSNVIAETYWQTMPIRWFFPSIILFMAVHYEKKNENMATLKKCLPGFLVCSFAILWETETGLFVAIIWSAYCILRFFQDKAVIVKNIFKTFLIHGIAFVCEILLAMILMNIYNVSVGGTIEKRAFFFPLLSDFSSILQTELKFGNMYYVYAISISMCCLLWACVQIFYWKSNCNYVCTIAAISLMAFAMLTFYMNRTLAGCCNAYTYIIMCNGILVSASIEPLRNFIRTQKSTLYDISKIAIGAIPMVTLTITVFLSSYTFVKAEERFKRKDYDISGLCAIAEEIKAVVPPNSYAIGIGTSDIYGLLSWNPQYHMRDFADLGSGGKGEEIISHIKSDISKQQDVFVGTGEYQLLPADFTLMKEFNFYGQTYGYFHRHI